jgi:hypothetical protein
MAPQRDATNEVVLTRPLEDNHLSDDSLLYRGPVPRLFSYGTLQRAEIQRSLFGRALPGEHDELIGFRHSAIDLDDPDVLQSTLASGKTAWVYTDSRATSQS